MIRTLKPIIVKEFRQIRRDPTSLGMLLVLPAVLIVMVGYALNFDVKQIPLAIFDQSNTKESREFLRTFKHTEYFDHRFSVSSYGEIERLFLDNDAKVALVIPRNFGELIFGDEDVAVQILVDGSDNTSAGQAIGYAVGMANGYSNRLVMQKLQRLGRNEYVPIDFRPRIWYNPDLLSALFLVPGLIGFIIVLTAVISTSMTVVREKERGTMEQLMVSPLNPLQIVLGKTLPYMAISLVGSTVIIVLAYLLFGIDVKGSLFLLYAGIVVLLLGALGQGLLISTITDSQQVAFMISVFSSLLPSFLLSGFVFPISNMPVFLQVLSNVAVTKFFLVVVRGVMLKGVGFFEVWDQFLYMTIFTAVVLGVTTLRMQKRSA